MSSVRVVSGTGSGGASIAIFTLWFWFHLKHKIATIDQKVMTVSDLQREYCDEEGSCGDETFSDLEDEEDGIDPDRLNVGGRWAMDPIGGGDDLHFAGEESFSSPLCH
jgi:hypothetical protein